MGGQTTSQGPNAQLQQAAGGIRRVTLGGLAVNLLLVVIKFTAGWLGHSQVVMADAVHSLTDSVTDIVLLVGVHYWSEPPDDCHPHGHRRIETLVTLIIGVSLAVVGLGLGWHAITTWRAGAGHVPGTIALFAALISIVSKEILYHWTKAVGLKVKSKAVLANAWHHRADALSSLPAAIAVGAVLLKPEWAILDQIGTLVITLFILYAAWQIIAPSLGELMDAGAPQDVQLQLQQLAESVAGVENVEKLRTRFVGGQIQVDLHVRVKATLSVHAGHEIAHHVRDKLLADGPDVVDVLVHIEPFE